jgi:hypothetical protein
MGERVGEAGSGGSARLYSSSEDALVCSEQAGLQAKQARAEAAARALDAGLPVIRASKSLWARPPWDRGKTPPSEAQAWQAVSAPPSDCRGSTVSGERPRPAASQPPPVAPPAAPRTQAKAAQAAPGRQDPIAHEFSALDRELGKLKESAFMQNVAVRPPAMAFQGMMVGELSIPIAQLASFAMDLVPVAGQIKLGAEAVVGREMAGMGPPLEGRDRLVRGALAALPAVGKLMGSGAARAGAVVAMANRTGQPVGQVVGVLRALRSLEKEAPAIEAALARRAAGTPLTRPEAQLLERTAATLARTEHAAAPPRTPAAAALAQDAGVASRARRLPAAGGSPPPAPKYYTPRIRGTPHLPAGEGATNKYGDVWYSTHGTARDRALVIAHEQVHSSLSPKAMNAFREFRADVSMRLYKDSPIMKALEEAIAETVAQVRVNGLSANSLKVGIRFPVTNGYVTVRDLRLEAAALAHSTIVVAGVTYGVFVTVEKAVKHLEASQKEKP